MRAPFAPRGEADPSTSRAVRAALKAHGLAPVAGFARAAAAPILPAPLPGVAVTRPGAGYMHPASKAEIERVLRWLGPAYTYGLRLVALVRRPTGVWRGGHAGSSVLRFGSLRLPGAVLLYEQRSSPWILAGRLRDDAAGRFRLAGAEIAVAGEGLQTVIAWPGDTLRDFMRFDVLLHELGHHQMQHYKGKRLARVARTRDHERFADRFAHRARRLLESQDCRLTG